jgi:hypothetical protein
MLTAPVRPVSHRVVGRRDHENQRHVRGLENVVDEHAQERTECLIE